jgi:SOS response regulatory protein OraA/RecX
MTKRTNNQELNQALDKLASYLAVRDHSRLELQNKLSGNFPSEIIAEALALAESKRWLQPEEEIAARAAVVFQRKLKSRSYIENQLAKRGLPLPPRDDEAERATARAAVEKKFGPIGELDIERRRQALRFLAGRGFDEHTMGMVLNAEF